MVGLFIILFLILGILLFFNAPLVVAIGLSTIIVLLMEEYNIAIFAQRTLMAANSFPLLAIPFFMLAGKLMDVGGMSKRIVRLANCLVGWMTGGLGHVVVLASAFFGALSGSAPATTAAIGSTLIPEMKQKGFPPDYVAGLQAVSGSLGTIIPPSIPMIIYGVATGTSIGKLFIGGIVPGILLSAFLMVMVYFTSKKREIKQTGTFSFKELVASFIDSIWALLVPIIILGGIYGGIFTPTEAGAVAVVYGFIAATFIYKELNLKDFKEIIGGAITNTILVMVIIAVSGAFSWLLTTTGLTKYTGLFITTVAANVFIFLLLSNILLLFIGAFIETVAGILILTPILFPIAQSFGIDPVHFGIIIVVNLSLGMSTPPVGENQYIAAAIAKVPFDKEVKAALPFLVTAIVALFIITFFPIVTLWLPNTLGL